MLRCMPPPQGPSLDPNETVFTRTVRDYVFMCFAPSFLRSPGGAVTRIPESKQSRLPLSWNELSNLLKNKK